jgi:glycosidase
LAKFGWLVGLLAIAACERASPPDQPPVAPVVPAVEQTPVGKPVIYQLMTRLFGNQKTANVRWGTAEQNGVGKFADISDAALRELKAMGVSHVWTTGVLHHALVADYTAHGIDGDDPDVVKGRAGSPYAIKDYYDVNPDLAIDPAQRLAEFDALIARVHAHGLKLVIDIVPNHVARRYRSTMAPAGVRDFGADDDRSVEYARDNSFYYVPGEAFVVPAWPASYRPLGGEPHPLADGRFDENPAKWTGNGARSPQPKFDDWYETVKINFGVRPDGSADFPRLPDDYRTRSTAEHHAFWARQNVPATWVKFRDIVRYWLARGVDGFRFDMAEMVPVEFWSYLNSEIKAIDPNALLIAEIYNPAEYRNFIALGRMDVLYDKVDFYDSLKLVMQGQGETSALIDIQSRYADIESHLLHFLENHDEQRIASPDFAGDAAMGKPGMLVSALISRSPTLIYFGQEVGEKGEGDAGFGKATRTTIFDYWGVPAHQRWMNGGAFDGGGLSADEAQLRAFYVRLLGLSATAPAMRGDYAELHTHNLARGSGYGPKQLAFARFAGEQRLIVVANFERSERALTLALSPDLVARWQLPTGDRRWQERIDGGGEAVLRVADEATMELRLPPLAAWVLEEDRE